LPSSTVGTDLQSEIEHISKTIANYNLAFNRPQNFKLATGKQFMQQLQTLEALQSQIVSIRNDIVRKSNTTGAETPVRWTPPQTTKVGS